MRRQVVDPVSSFHSILFPHCDEATVPQTAPPDCFPDLHLDDIVDAITTGQTEDNLLESFFHLPLHETRTVEYRQQVFRDLEHDGTRAIFRRFVDSVLSVQQQLDQTATIWHPLQRQGRLVDAAELYCQTISTLHDDLIRARASSAGLRDFADYIARYIESDTFHKLAADTYTIRQRLEEVHYTVHIQNLRVHVERFDNETDYSISVVDSFKRFATEARDDHRVPFKNYPDMNHVEEQVLECVAKLYPETFSGLESYCQHNQNFVEPTIARFHDEVRFYLSYLAFLSRFRHAELPFSYPGITADPGVIDVETAFDLALAIKLSPDKLPVCNDFRLSGPERIIVVTGPNQGGKTTFARTIGQCAYLASLGCPIPAKRATMMLPDQIYTHFERQEAVATLHGKLDNELVRIREILENATAASIVVMNESFSSTTLNDALFIGTEVLQRITALNCVAVYVSFLDELADLNPACVSMVGDVADDDPTQRTFTFTRRPADGLAYAAALADKYELNYDTLRRKITR